jgi:hypothetical protein
MKCQDHGPGYKSLPYVPAGVLVTRAPGIGRTARRKSWLRTVNPKAVPFVMFPAFLDGLVGVRRGCVS